ncbi:type II secretion system protein [uncultured Gimesia sp.]|uniref:type II secretion system protein n=1 Tax=uncultured Gimesia sp. TaxID=1678688 RepID=UPI00261D9BC8|nr:prepilin-type N-terminal cleavage/methylation domain-containing protein [uncultured Gimesia sp.]
MKKGFTLIELMVAVATMAVLIALLLPDIQTEKDASLTGTQKEGPFWVYREYEYAGGPVISEISGSYQHSLQEILDMYVINLKKDQIKYAQELQADPEREATSPKHSVPQAETVSSPVSDLVVNPAAEISFSRTKPSKEEQIRKAKQGIKNLKKDLSQNHALLCARRNVKKAIAELQEDIRILESQP